MSDVFEFQRVEGEDLSIQDAVSQAIQAAATCWDNTSGAGAFHATCAKDIEDALVEYLKDEWLS